MSFSITNTLFFLFFLSLGTFVKGQNYIPETQIYSVEEGLSHRQVNDILEDRKGFIWIATPYGLNRFDGYSFKVWGQEDGLQSDQVERIFEDAYGFIWLFYPKSVGAIDLFDPKTNKIIPFAAQYGDKIPGGFKNKTGKPFLTKDSTLYWTTRTSFFTFHPKSGYHSVAIQQDSSAKFSLHFISSQKTVWGTIEKPGQNNTIVELDQHGVVLQQIPCNGSEVTFVRPGRSPEGSVNYFNLLDVVTRTAQCLRIGEDNNTSEIASGLLLPAFDYQWHVTTLATLNDRNLLFSDFRVFDLVSKTILYDFNNFRPGISGRPRAFLVDRSGKIWLGSDFGLLQVNINQNRFRRYLFSADADAIRIRCRGIIEKDNQLIFNTQGAMYTCPKTRFSSSKPLDAPQKVSGTEKQIWLALTADQSGNVFASMDSSIFRLEKEAGMKDAPWSKKSLTVHRESSADKTKGDFPTPWVMYPVAPNQLLMGTESDGLQIYHLSTRQRSHFTAYNAFPELAKAGVMAIQPDREGNIWICASTGFYRFDLEKGIMERHWQNGTQENHLPSSNFCHFYEDQEGIFWLASNGGGLIRWDRKKGTSTQLARKAGFPSNTLYAVYEDGNDHLWIPSSSGLIQFNKKMGAVSSVYRKEDGITDNEFNRISHFKGADGAMYFGGLNGVTAFQPNDFYEKNDAGSLPLVVTHFQQFDGNTNQLIDKTGDLVIRNEIVLRPDDRFLNLEFALLSFTQTKHIQYAFKMEGVDADWTYQNEPVLRLSRLPYGTHILHIKGQAANGIWGSNELNIKVKVLRPFYLQFWFLLLSLLTISLTIRFFFKWRTRELQHNQKLLQEEVRLQTEKIQGQTEELRQLDTLKTRLYTNITHEFRTPLTVILGMTDEIEELDKGNTPLTYATGLIRRNGKNLLRLINQLLDLSKLDSGTMKTHWVQTDIIKYLQYLTESFYSLAQDKKVRLTFYPEIPELVMDFDEEKLQIIIYNLLSNAIKFTGDRGKVVLHAAQTGEGNARFLQLKIQDTGVGIAAEELPFIFDRFYQADNSSTRKSEGTGIGLTLTKELIELMGGNITVESATSKGTTFTVLLPVRQDIPSSVPTPFAPVSQKIAPAFQQDLPVSVPSPVPAIVNTDKPFLLIIEDNPDVVVYLEGLLKKDYQVETASNGKLGIEKALEMVPDIIISDVMMPEKDGYEVCDTLKNDLRTSHIPIILLTAKASQEDKVTGLRAGADAYLQKPFDKAELFVRLEKLIALRHRLQARYRSDESIDPLSTTAPVGAVASPSETPTLEDLFLQKLRQVVESQMGEPEFGIQHLCRAVNLSNTQVFRKLKALTGENASYFIRQIRLQSALKLLQTTDMNVSEIAYEVGFSDPNYFSRVFHEVYGKAPSDVRR